MDFRKRSAPPTPLTPRYFPGDLRVTYIFGTIITQTPDRNRTYDGAPLRCPSPNPSSPPPTPSGMLLLLPVRRADCSVSFALLRRLSTTICHLSRTCALSSRSVPINNKLLLCRLCRFCSYNYKYTAAFLSLASVQYTQKEYKIETIKHMNRNK